MAHYAKHNGVGTAKSLPEGAIEINAEQYRGALEAQSAGMRVTVTEGEMTVYKSPVYRPDGSKASEYTPGDPLITDAPPSELHVPAWENGAWIESETAEQKQAREEAEAAAERERLDAVTVTRFQAKAALDAAGLLDQVDDYMTGDEVPRLVKLAWQEAGFRRGSKMINDIGSELGLSESEMDALFEQARGIDV